MGIIIAGAEYKVGKSIIAAWLCEQCKYSYVKPIQTGDEIFCFDNERMKKLIGSKAIVEDLMYVYKEGTLPYETIDVNIELAAAGVPNLDDIVVESPEELLTPLNENGEFTVDFIKAVELPVILVTTAVLGSLNSALLSLEVLKSRDIPVLGIITNGPVLHENDKYMEECGKVPVLATFPYLEEVDNKALAEIPLSDRLKEVMGYWDQ